MLKNSINNFLSTLISLFCVDLCIMLLSQYGYQLSWAMLRYAHFDLVLAFIGLEEEISVHQVVMCAASRVFAAMFEHDTQERRERRVEIEDFSPHIMQLLVHFAYHEAVELSSHSLDTLEALILAADKVSLFVVVGSRSSFHFLSFLK